MNSIIPFARNGNRIAAVEIPDFDTKSEKAESSRRIAEHYRDLESRMAEARATEERRANAEAIAAEKRRLAKRLDRNIRKEAWWSKIAFTNGYKILAHEYFTRQIRGHLTPAEQSVFFFVFDRTVAWLKEWETIRMPQFTVGSLPDEAGVRAFWGTGMSERTVQSTLKVLVADGLVRRRAKRGGNGLVEYALPWAHQVRDLPRFAGVNITHRGVFIRPGEPPVEVTL